MSIHRNGWIVPGRALITALVAVTATLSIPATRAVADATLVIDNAFWPSWSPLGDALLCTRATPTMSDEDMQIWIVPLDGQPPDTLTRDPSGAFCPMWLPGGTSFVYYRIREGVSGSHREFVVQSLETGPIAVWEAAGVWDDYGLYLSPDGSEVIYTTDSRETWALSLSTGATRFVIGEPGGTISPDGMWIAYVGEGDTLAVAPLGGGAEHRFEYGGWARWTPDSRHIVFTAFGSGGNPDLVVVSRDGSNRKQLTDDAEIEWWNDLSPSGDRVIYSKSAGEFRPHSLWMFDLELPVAARTTTWGRIKAAYR